MGVTSTRAVRHRESAGVESAVAPATTPTWSPTSADAYGSRWRSHHFIGEPARQGTWSGCCGNAPSLALRVESFRRSRRVGPVDVQDLPALLSALEHDGFRAVDVDLSIPERAMHSVFAYVQCDIRSYLQSVPRRF